jgi:anti-sigma-K factor RskA
MSAPPPVDGHTEEFEQLAGLSALDALDGEDRARFERHAADCARCRRMERLDREAVAGLSLVAPEIDPSPDFKARLMQRAAEELAARPPQQLPARPTERLPDRPPANVIPIWRRQPHWLQAVAAVLVLALLSVGAYGFQNQVVVTAEMAAPGQGSGTVTVRRNGSAQLQLQGLPDPEPGFIYEAWIIPNGQQPVAAGVGTSGNASIPLSGDPRGTTVAVTRERSRVDAPTSAPLMAGEIST